MANATRKVLADGHRHELKLESSQLAESFALGMLGATRRQPPEVLARVLTVEIAETRLLPD